MSRRQPFLENLQFGEFALMLKILLFGVCWTLRRNRSTLLRSVDIPLGNKGIVRERVVAAANAAFYLLKFIPMAGFACLFQSVALCRALRQNGENAHLVLGAGRINGSLTGHAWVRFQGEAADEDSQFSEICVLPAASALR